MIWINPAVLWLIARPQFTTISPGMDRVGADNSCLSIISSCKTFSSGIRSPFVHGAVWLEFRFGSSSSIDSAATYGKMPYLIALIGGELQGHGPEDYVMVRPARFDLKLDKEDKELFSEAAALMGTSMAGFVRAAAKEKARSVIDQEARLTLSRRDFRAFNAALDQAFAPNRPLQEALETARQTVRRA